MRTSGLASLDLNRGSGSGGLEGMGVMAPPPFSGEAEEGVLCFFEDEETISHFIYVCQVLFVFVPCDILSHLCPHEPHFRLV